MPVHALTMLAAGIGIPVLAALNARLGAFIGSPAAAAVILFCVALVVALVTMFVIDPRPIARAVEAPRHLFLGGIFVAFYVLSVTFRCIPVSNLTCTGYGSVVASSATSARRSTNDAR